MSTRFIVFPDQLVLAVIDVGVGSRAVADAQNITVIIIGVGVGFGNTARDGLVGSDLVSLYLYYSPICKF